MNSAASGFAVNFQALAQNEKLAGAPHQAQTPGPSTGGTKRDRHRGQVVEREPTTTLPCLAPFSHHAPQATIGRHPQAHTPVHTDAHTDWPPLIAHISPSTTTALETHRPTLTHKLTDSLPKGPGAVRPTTNLFNDGRLLCPLQHVVQNCFVVCRLRVEYGEACLLISCTTPFLESTSSN